MTREYKCHDYAELKAFLEAILGTRPVGSDPDHEEIAVDKAPEANAHLKAVLGDAYTSVWELVREWPKPKGGMAAHYEKELTQQAKRRKALAQYLQSMAELLDPELCSPKKPTGPDVFGDVQAFRIAFNQPHMPHIGFPSAERIWRRIQWCEEEIAEIKRAVFEHDLVGVTDGFHDLTYFAVGSHEEFGYTGEATWRDIHGANMDKLVDGKPIIINGKVQKPKGWVPPDARIAGHHRALGYVRENWAGHDVIPPTWYTGSWLQYCPTVATEAPHPPIAYDPPGSGIIMQEGFDRSGPEADIPFK